MKAVGLGAFWLGVGRERDEEEKEDPFKDMPSLKGVVEYLSLSITGKNLHGSQWSKVSTKKLHEFSVSM